MVNEILKHNHFTFLSPHLDDAVLSCGSLIALLIKARKHVRIITLFTQANEEPKTSFAQTFVRESGFSDASELFKERKKEDHLAMRSLGVSDVWYLPHVDAAWRQYPDSKHVFSGKIHPDDQLLVAHISQELKNTVPEGTVLFAPLGIGQHVDHVITHLCAKKGVTDKQYYWADHPYVSYKKNRPVKPPFQLLISLHPNREKITASACYLSQLKPLLPSYSPTTQPEQFYVDETTSATR